MLTTWEDHFRELHFASTTPQ